jgi:uncharacterized protein (TIRG00374 family)
MRSIDVHAMLQSLAHVEWQWLAIPCALYPLSLLLSSIKLKRLLEGYEIPISIGSAFRLNWIGGFFNNFFPSTIGGDVYRLVMLNRWYTGRPAQIVSSIILDRGLGFVAMLIVAVSLGPTLLPSRLPANVPVLTLCVLVGVAILGALAFLFSRLRFRVPGRARRDLFGKIANGLDVLINYPQRKKLALSLLISLGVVSLATASLGAVVRALGWDVSPVALLFVTCAINLAGLVPVSINAIGVTEGAGTALLALFGVQVEVALAALLIIRILLIACSATGAIPFLFDRTARDRKASEALPRQWTT